jgi:4-hydroxy-tetrahydrodipicolinate synthase
MLDRLIDAGVDPGVLMPGTGCCALTDTVKLTAHAVRRGCGGVLMLPPFYYKGISDDGLFRSFAEVIERVGDGRLRVYLYHIPPQAVVGFSLPLIERLLKAYPGIVVGMKDSSGDWNNMDAVMSAFPGFGFFTGSEKFLLATLRKGGVGSINAVANIMPPPQRRLYDNWQSADADAMQEEINGMRTLLQGVPVIPALKQIVAHLHHDPEWLHVRPPFTVLAEAQSKAVIAGLAALQPLLAPVAA